MKVRITEAHDHWFSPSQRAISVAFVVEDNGPVAEGRIISYNEEDVWRDILSEVDKQFLQKATTRSSVRELVGQERELDKELPTGIN